MYQVYVHVFVRVCILYQYIYDIKALIFIIIVGS